ncbi:MAG: alpha/beta hydrolase [Candidatus Nitronauta litoralis]|uniref:Alpha/beta hydrolase n=1 Tax=Candidatus Nitronauta litoralis TaxID=2705533 RepID=A0A7T0G1K1_9BACT|nr:MAG: alpha/beta hydrolase [Candidatus Nitronauta litoralis]
MFMSLVLVVSLVIVLIPFFENRVIYHPICYPNGLWNPESEGLNVENVWFKSPDGTQLHGWFVPTSKAKTTLLWFHGNAGNLSHRSENIQKLQSLGTNIFIFDYRGYGRSEGKPGARGLSKDSQAAYDWLVKGKNISPENIILFGRSLGGVFAAEVAANNRAAGLILESTFTNIRDMSREVIPLVPVHPFLRASFDPEAILKTLTIPKLILHGTDDKIIPYRLGRALFNSAAEPKKFYDIKGSGHNDTYVTGGEDYFNTILDFIKLAVS